MAETSVFRGAINFFDHLGIYDVVLPFLLVFSISYAILDKTKVLGTEKYSEGDNNEEQPKRSLNAIVAFVIGFFVVASSQLVAIINEALGNLIIVLLLIVMFLMLIGAFFKNGEDVYLEDGAWRIGFMIFVLVATVFIFLHAIPTSDGGNWLNASWLWISRHWDSTAIGSIIMLIIFIVLIASITKSGGGSKKKNSDE